MFFIEDLLLKKAITRRKSLWEGVKEEIVYTIGSEKSAIRGSIKISNNRNNSLDTIFMNLERFSKNFAEDKIMIRLMVFHI